jgi:hypothetical protein
MARSHEQGPGGPADNEIEDLKNRSRALDQRASEFNASLPDFNASVARHAADLERFNHEVSRYDLMMAYPDGLDEDSVVQAKNEVRPKGGWYTQRKLSSRWGQQPF